MQYDCIKKNIPMFQSPIVQRRPTSILIQDAAMSTFMHLQGKYINISTLQLIFIHCGFVVSLSTQNISWLASSLGTNEGVLITDTAVHVIFRTALSISDISFLRFGSFRKPKKNKKILCLLLNFLWLSAVRFRGAHVSA